MKLRVYFYWPLFILLFVVLIVGVYLYKSATDTGLLENDLDKYVEPYAEQYMDTEYGFSVTYSWGEPFGAWMQVSSRDGDSTLLDSIDLDGAFEKYIHFQDPRNKISHFYILVAEKEFEYLPKINDKTLVRHSKNKQGIPFVIIGNSHARYIHDGKTIVLGAEGVGKEGSIMLGEAEMFFASLIFE